MTYAGQQRLAYQISGTSFVGVMVFGVAAAAGMILQDHPFVKVLFGLLGAGFVLPLNFAVFRAMARGLWRVSGDATLQIPWMRRDDLFGPSRSLRRRFWSWFLCLSDLESADARR